MRSPVLERRRRSTKEKAVITKPSSEGQMTREAPEMHRMRGIEGQRKKKGKRGASPSNKRRQWRHWKRGIVQYLDRLIVLREVEKGNGSSLTEDCYSANRTGRRACVLSQSR